MTLVAQHENTLVLNLARGEELGDTLRHFCSERSIQGAIFTGLGAADKVTLGYYDLGMKTYERRDIVEDVEILSLTGNWGLLHDEGVLHCHGIFGRRDLSTFGGHVFSLRVSGACEVHLTVLPVPLLRQYDPITGLNLLTGGKEHDPAARADKAV